MSIVGERSTEADAEVEEAAAPPPSAAAETIDRPITTTEAPLLSSEVARVPSRAEAAVETEEDEEAAGDGSTTVLRRGDAAVGDNSHISSEELLPSCCRWCLGDLTKEGCAKKPIG